MIKVVSFFLYYFFSNDPYVVVTDNIMCYKTIRLLSNSRDLRRRMYIKNSFKFSIFYNMNKKISFIYD